MWGRATAEAIVPYEALVEALAHRAALGVRRRAPTRARRPSRPGRAGAGVVGDSDEQGDDAAPEVGTDRYVLFETVAELLEAESAVHPIVFVLDDLQYVDSASPSGCCSTCCTTTDRRG